MEEDRRCREEVTQNTFYPKKNSHKKREIFNKIFSKKICLINDVHMHINRAVCCGYLYLLVNINTAA